MFSKEFWTDDLVGIFTCLVFTWAIGLGSGIVVDRTQKKTETVEQTPVVQSIAQVSPACQVYIGWKMKTKLDEPDMDTVCNLASFPLVSAEQ